MGHSLKHSPAEYSYKMPLEKDNPGHRNVSNNLDNKYKDSAVWNKVVRPVVHGTYHTGRAVTSGNTEEWARAKDQFSKVGTGQTQTEYLKQHREEAKAAQEREAKAAKEREAKK